MGGRLVSILALLLAVACVPLRAPPGAGRGGGRGPNGELEWPRWRGPRGSAVSGAKDLPLTWSRTRGIRWRTQVPGEGSSSPIVWDDRVVVTSARDDGLVRMVHALDRSDGRLVWTREIEDEDPELSSAVTGWAAPTPVTDGHRLIAFFANAGVVCLDRGGDILWRRRLGPFDSELGLASSPVVVGDRVILVCDHDGDRLTSFDSFLVSLDCDDGETIWRTDRPGLFRSWSTPIHVPDDGDGGALVVNGQDELRAYDPASGRLLWWVRGMTGWVTPSPVFGQGLVFATSGKAGPLLAVLPGGRGDVTGSHVVWRREAVGPYVCSPVLVDEYLYVIDEQGILACYRAREGEPVYRRRLEGKFVGSPVAGAGRIYLTNEAGTTFVIASGPEPRELARNALDEYCVASPALVEGAIVLRTEKAIYCLDGKSQEAGDGDSSVSGDAAAAAEARAVAYLSREVPRWSAENGCHSCHHDGDGARALYLASTLGYGEVTESALRETGRWLARPAAWGSDPAARGHGDPRLGRVQFSAALARAVEAGVGGPVSQAALRVAAGRLARDQGDDGAWRPEAVESPGSPITYGAHLATWLALTVVEAAETVDRDCSRRARDWLRGAPARNVIEAATVLLGLGGTGDASEISRRQVECLSFLRRAQTGSGGWGPYLRSSPEVFDTAVALLAIASSCGDGTGDMIRRGREYLANAQEADGGWPETTRPAGAASHAHRVSTTAWATIALLRTRP